MIDFIVGYVVYYLRFCFMVLLEISLAILAFMPVIIVFSFYEDKLIPKIKKILT